VTAKRQIVDTNVLVRFLTGEPPVMASKARRLVERADEGKLILIILPVIVAEAMYTLESFYAMKRKEVAAQLLAFIQSRGIEAAEPARVIDALTRCRDRAAHFADAYLAAAAVELRHPISSFDRDFDHFKEVTRFGPET
jgi:predicted nucleic acid-binding protein